MSCPNIFYLKVIRCGEKKSSSLPHRYLRVEIQEINLWKFKSLDVIYECSLKCKSCLQQTRCGWCSLDSDGMGACLEGTLQGPSHVTHCDMANYTHSGMYLPYISCTINCTFVVLLHYSFCTFAVVFVYL